MVSPDTLMNRELDATNYPAGVSDIRDGFYGVLETEIDNAI